MFWARSWCSTLKTSLQPCSATWWVACWQTAVTQPSFLIPPVCYPSYWHSPSFPVPRAQSYLSQCITEGDPYQRNVPALPSLSARRGASYRKCRSCKDSHLLVPVAAPVVPRSYVSQIFPLLNKLSDSSCQKRNLKFLNTYFKKVIHLHFRKARTFLRRI